MILDYLVVFLGKVPRYNIFKNKIVGLQITNL